jgi:methylphosphotriester-DNA--protein-cysteine methyltransferase
MVRGMRLRRLQNADEFLRDPVGAAVSVGGSLAWCASPAVGGAIMLRGNQNPDETREVLRAFAIYRGPHVTPPLRLLFDATAAAEGVDHGSLMMLLEWLRAERETIAARLGFLVGVIPPGLIGITLAGLLPAAGVGDVSNVAVTPDRAEAFRLLGVPDLQAAVDAEVAAAQTEPPLVRALRTLLRQTPARLTLDEAARRLGRSPRALQRELAAHGLTFRREQDAISFAQVTALLATGQTKVAAIAAELGVSEHGLALIVRRGCGLSVAEYRERLQRR